MYFLSSQLQQAQPLPPLEVLVFKTNLNSQLEVKTIEPLLASIQNIIEWSVDTNDIDKVLRVEVIQISSEEIIAAIKEAGYQCEELTY